MAKKLKHKKLRNTGLIYELLVRQITSDVLNGRVPKSLDIVKKFFKKGSLLSEELKLFNTVLNYKVKNSEFASEILEAVLKAKAKINKQALDKEKYLLIKEINNKLNQDHFFKTQVQDYITYASIANLLEYQPEDNPAEYVTNKITVLEYISKPKQENQLQQKSEIMSDVDPELKSLTFKLLIEKFNNRWGSLDKQQRSILRHFIYNTVDSKKSREFLSEQVLYLKTNLRTTLSKVKDPVVKIKVDEVIKVLEEIPSMNFLSESTYLALLRSHELLKEVKNKND